MEVKEQEVKEILVTFDSLLLCAFQRLTPGLKTWQQVGFCWMNSLSVLFVLFLLTQVLTCGVVLNCLELTMYTWLT